MERLEIAHVKSLDQHICTNGFKRGAALKNPGRKTAQVIIHTVSLFEARIMAACANRGQVASARTRADKRRAVEMYLDALVESQVPGRPSSRMIAKEIGGGISDFLVRSMMKQREIDEPEKDESVPLPKDEEPKAKKKEAPVASVDSGDWRTVPLREFIDADPFIWDAIDKLKIETAGDLHERLFKGKEKLGMQLSDVDELKGQVERMRTSAEASGDKPAPPPKEKKQGEEKGFNFREFDSCFGIVARGPDEFVKHYPRYHRSPHYNVVISKMTEARQAWDAMVAQALGKK